MTAVRVLLALVAVLFAVQMVCGGVQRRDTAAATADPLSGLIDSLVAGANDLRSRMESLAQNSNASHVLSQLSSQFQEFQNRLSQVAQNVSQGLSS